MGAHEIRLDLIRPKRWRITRLRPGFAAAVKARPSAFFTRVLENRIVTGNFEDDLKLCAEADWIVEVVAENLDIKRALLAGVAQFRKPGTSVTTTPSGLP